MMLDGVRRNLSPIVSAVLLIWMSAVPAAEPTLRITRSQPRLDPALLRGFVALNAGDLATAEREYGQALKSEPGNPDALHGAASIALRRNDCGLAEAFFRRAIAANPRDAVAQAGLAGLHGRVDPIATETALKSLLAIQPDQPSLYFALGNLYAASERWPDAQQAFFSAYAGDPDQPDYVFNLAVSLDHLHQGKLARRYYEMALSAADRHPAGFDPRQIAARIHDLAP